MGGDGEPTERSEAVLPEDETAVLESRGVVEKTEAVYATYGDPNGSPVVFAHPAPGSRVFGRLLADVAAELGVYLVVPQRNGYGDSPSRITGRGSLLRRQTPEIGDILYPVWDVLEHLDVQSYGVLGFSSGCPFALSIASQESHRVEDLVLVSSTAPPFATGAILPMEQSIRALSPLEERQYQIVPPDPNSAQGQRIGDAMDWLRENLEDLDSQEVEYLYGIPKLLTGVAPTLRRDLEVALRWRSRGYAIERWLLSREWAWRIEGIDVPVTLFHGTADPFGSPDLARELVPFFDSGHLGTVEGEGHLSTLTTSAGTALRHAAPSLTPLADATD